MEKFLWVEKYRPSTIEQTILLDKYKQSFEAIVKSGEIPNMIFSGGAGLGKTTVARALCNELGLDFILINGSEEGNIDTLRNKIKQFASTISINGGYKVVILDEADYLNPNSFQPALRGFIEEFSTNCRFILTCNFLNRIIAPLHSRCSIYDFNVSAKEKAQLCGKFLKRVKTILQTENIDYNDQVVAGVIIKYAPDWRRILSELQRMSTVGSINDADQISKHSNAGELFSFLKEKDFKKMRQWVVNNLDNDSSSLIRSIYDEFNGKVKPTSIPQLILILADYQYKAAFVADQEINLVACMTEIMMNIQFE